MEGKPLPDRIPVGRIEGETRSKGGIMIPSAAQEKPQANQVEGEEHFIIREDDVLAASE